MTSVRSSAGGRDPSRHPTQFDLDGGARTVPAQSVKPRNRRVPRSWDAVAGVRAALNRDRSRYVFHGRDGRPIRTHAAAVSYRLNPAAPSRWRRG